MDENEVTKDEVTKEVSLEMEREAAQRAREKASAGRWDLNVAIFLFAVMILIIILATYTRAGLEVVGPVAVFGLATVWLVGWRRGRQLYRRFYAEELTRLELGARMRVRETAQETPKKTEEETVEERVQKALRQRRR